MVSEENIWYEQEFSGSKKSFWAFLLGILSILKIAKVFNVIITTILTLVKKGVDKNLDPEAVVLICSST